MLCTAAQYMLRFLVQFHNSNQFQIYRITWSYSSRHSQALLNNTVTEYINVFLLTGIIAGMWPCGIITFLSELYVAESKTQVYGALHDFMQKNTTPYVYTRPFYIAILFVLILIIYSAGYICYDDGCHLRRFAQNPSRRDLTPTTNNIASIEIVVDKMHITGHTDKWCLENCDARKHPELNDVSYMHIFNR